MISEDTVLTLEKTANEIRKSIISMLLEAKSGHTAGPLGMADIFTAFYFHLLKHDSHNPSWKERDLVVLSNGHICPVLYATMAHAGYFPVEELQTLRKFGSKLQGHPHREFLPALETSSGPLGSGLSQAVGMALALRVNKNSAENKGEKSTDADRFVYCFLGDGELNEGQNWEAIMLAGKEKLGNLVAVVDRNHIQIDGFTEDVMPLEPLHDKWKAFNWNVIGINGHDFKQIVAAVEEAKKQNGKTNARPTVILAQNIPGKGVKEFENKPYWHGNPPNKEQADMALAELRALDEKRTTTSASAVTKTKKNFLTSLFNK
jgi:transketolase